MLGKENYLSLINKAKNAFKNSEEYAQNQDIKNLIGQMKITKRNLFASKWIEGLGVSMAATCGYRLLENPDGEMIALVCAGVAGSIIAHLVKKRSKEEYEIAEEELSQHINNVGAIDNSSECGLSEESLSVYTSDVCNEIVDSQREWGYY